MIYGDRRDNNMFGLAFSFDEAHGNLTMISCSVFHLFPSHSSHFSHSSYSPYSYVKIVVSS